MKPVILCVDDESIVLTALEEQLTAKFGDYTIIGSEEKLKKFVQNRFTLC